MYKRTILMYRREPVLTRARLGQAVVVAIIVGLIFLQLGDSQVRRDAVDEPSSRRRRAGADWPTVAREGN